MDRRAFLATCGGAVSYLCLGSRRAQGAAPEGKGEGPRAGALAVLVDTTRCEGCRTCEEACAEANGLPSPDSWQEEDSTEATEPVPGRWSVVTTHETEQGEVYCKRQCMHCLQPACSAACLTRAMEKHPEGPVTWTEDRCMGCRYCMLSCPFDVPTFEYDSPVPRIQKCQMCWARIEDGQLPACVEACPAEALTFGPRESMLQEARRRIAEDPGAYRPTIYGEHEAGGTSWLYLAAVPFETLGFRTDLGTTAYPELTRGFLSSVPIVLTLWPALMVGLSRARRPDGQDAEEDDG